MDAARELLKVARELTAATGEKEYKAAVKAVEAYLKVVKSAKNKAGKMSAAKEIGQALRSLGNANGMISYHEAQQPVVETDIEKEARKVYMQSVEDDIWEYNDRDNLRKQTADVMKSIREEYSKNYDSKTWRAIEREIKQIVPDGLA